MRKALIAIVAGFAAISSAYAAEMQAVVSTIDHDARIVVLEDGTELTIAEGVDHSAVEEGDAVNLVVDDSTGMIVEIMLAE